MSAFQRVIHLVTFDVTHTLLKFRGTPAERYAMMTEKIGGVSVPIEEMTCRLKTSYGEMCRDYPNFGLNSDIGDWKEWWGLVVKNAVTHYVKDINTVNKIANELINSYEKSEFWSLNEGCVEMLDYLRASDLSLGVISNFDPRLNIILKNTGLLNYFDFVLSSYEAGFAKPDAEIFAKALSIPKKSIKPSQALHIGNDFKLDYEAARSAGWQSAIICEDTDTLKINNVNSEHIFDNLQCLRKKLLNHRELFKDLN